MRKFAMDPLTAETIGLNALGFIANLPKWLSRFLSASGAAEANLRERAAEPELLAAVLDFVLANEELLMLFCDKQSVDPGTVHRAAAQLGS